MLLLLGLVGGQGAGAVQQSWEISNRIRCAENLRTIGQAMRSYAIDDVRGGGHPRAVWDVETTDQPKFGTPYEGHDLGPRAGVNPYLTDAKPSVEEDLLRYTPEPNDVTASFYHLMRVSDLTPVHFICPATRRRPLEFGEELGQRGKWMYTNWPGHGALRDHLTYSFQNMYFSIDAVGRGAKWTDTLSAQYVLVADINPGGEALPDARMGDARDGRTSALNSPNHFGYGQNVLHADGAVRFITTPFEGPRRDNIYTFRSAGHAEAGDRPLGELASAGIVGSAYDGLDNVLLPTAELLKQEAPKFATEVEAQRALNDEPWRQEVLDRYRSRQQERR